MLAVNEHELLNVEETTGGRFSIFDFKNYCADIHAETHELEHIMGLVDFRGWFNPHLYAFAAFMKYPRHQWDRGTTPEGMKPLAMRYPDADQPAPSFPHRRIWGKP